MAAHDLVSSNSWFQTKYNPILMWNCNCSGRDNYWSSAFAWFFRPLWEDHDHLWTLVPVPCPPVPDGWTWQSFTYSAKVHFRCKVCSFSLFLFITSIELICWCWKRSDGKMIDVNGTVRKEHGGWTSMKGQVVFWYRMRSQGKSIITEVLFQTFSQQCNSCQAKGRVLVPSFLFSQSTWIDSFSKVLQNNIQSLLH